MFGKKASEYIPSACVTCGCLIEKGREQRVILFDSDPSSSTSSVDFIWWGSPPKNIYCGRCKPPYDEVRSQRFFRRVSEHFVEVTKDGKEIKPPKPKGP